MAGATNFLFIGNPGVGKSTILNGLIGTCLFRSGVSFGGGITFQLDVHTPPGQPHTYMDTPGLADPVMRQRAAEAITQALQQGGHYKIFFVLTLEQGRVRPGDCATMQLVLDAAPITSYGIIVNQVPPATYREICDNPRNLNPSPMEMILQCVWGLLRPEQRTPYVHFMRRDNDLDSQPNVVKRLPQDLRDFVQLLPGMVIDPATVKAVREHEHQEILEANELRITELVRNNENLVKALQMTQDEVANMRQACGKMQAEMEIRERQREEEQNRFQGQLQELQDEGRRRDEQHRREIDDLRRRPQGVPGQILRILGGILGELLARL